MLIAEFVDTEIGLQTSVRVENRFPKCLKDWQDGI